MKRLLPFILVLVAVVGCNQQPPINKTAPAEERKIDVPEADVKELAEGNTEFALDLFRTLAEKEPGNILFSPYSIRAALGMTYAGARGETAAEMRKALRFTLPDDQLHAAFGGVTESMQTAGKERAYTLDIASALWPQQGMKLKPGFLDLTGKHYGAGVREVDYIGKTEESRQTINKWVEGKTHDKIKELLKPGILDDMTRLVLTNAVYFQGNWKQQFDPSRTKEGDFEITAGNKVKVPMMNQWDMKIRVAGNEDFRLGELPYVGDRWKMMVMLPNKRNELKEVETRLTAKSLHDAIDKLHDSELPVSMPKFKLQRPSNLNESLKKLGMVRAFLDTKADFTGMVDGSLYISDVIHDAVIEVDEKGTVAAAATGVVMKSISAPMPLALDQPFLLILYDAHSRTILLSLIHI